MGRGAPRGPLEPKNDPKPGNRLHALLHGLWIRGHPTH
jgi:hypothetical protein